MFIRYQNGCSASCTGYCISSEFIWNSNYFLLYCVRFLDAEYVSAFFFRYLYGVSSCDFGVLQVDLHTSYVALFVCFLVLRVASSLQTDAISIVYVLPIPF